MLAWAPLSVAALEAPALRTAARFALLGGGAVTNSGPSRVTGNVGSPATVSGFPAAALAVGDVHAGDAVEREARGDEAAAYADLAARPCTVPFSNPLRPGVICLSSPLPNILTLDGGGDANALWVIRVAGPLVTPPDSEVVLTNGGSKDRVFWIADTVLLGARSVMAGTLFTRSGVTVSRGASLYGRAFAQDGPVTVDTALISFCCDAIAVSPLPPHIVSPSLPQSITAGGGTPPYAFRLFAGALPPGVVLRPTSASTAELAGTSSSSFSVILAATDLHGCAGIRTIAVDVTTIPCSQLLSIAPSTLPNGTAGVAYSQALTVTGGGTPPYTFLQPVRGALPPGFALAGDGAITGTPVLPGSYCFTVTGRDANGCVSGPADYTILVDPVSCPGATPITISPPGLPPAILNTPYARSFTASGGTPPYTFTSSALPPLLTLNPVSGLLSGIPTAAGVYPVTVTVTDAHGCFATTACSMFLAVDIPALSGGALLLLAVVLGAAGCIARRI